MKFVFIGMGGTNSLAIRPLLMYISPLPADEKQVVIVDGDSYSLSNMARQEFNPVFVNRNKAEAKQIELSRLFPDIVIRAEPHYLDESNLDYIVEDGDVVMLAVDCYLTRKIVDQYVERLKTILLVSMGNELSDGDVHVHCRINGETLSPSIQDGHPEITTASNRSRSKMSCEEIAALPSGGQLIFANLQAAVAGVSLAWGALTATKFLTEPTPLLNRGVYFDTQIMKVRPITNPIYQHKLSLK